ncbi:armadillo-type protein [Phycomyces blakesleeanus]|uniref:Armadillo-type protein n=1 Tax=Phycomyces blakesleeanus TaxID=4837 RepID=A0ABR3AVB9_PHYBL
MAQRKAKASSSASDPMGSPADSPPSSPGPSALANNPNKLLHRVSGFFFQHNRRVRSPTTGEPDLSPEEPDEEPSYLQPHEPMIQDIETASRVDSMFSMHSNHSARPINPNTPPPLRTVCLDNPTVHTSIAPVEQPPSPPPSSSSSKTVKQSPGRTIPLRKLSKLSPDDVNEAFELLLQEYALPTSLKPNLTQLTTEQKSVLLQSSRSRMLLRKNSTFSSSPFSLAATLGINRKSKGQPSNVRDRKFFSPSDKDDSSMANRSSASYQKSNGSTSTATATSSNTKSMGTSRGGKNTSLLAGGSHGDTNHRTVRGKMKSTPEYFVTVLRETHVRELEENDVADLRVFLRSVVASWTTEFLSLGGYEALSDLFRQMKEIPKKRPQDDKFLQQLAKCFKAIMTHEQSGTERVLMNPIGLEHIRDLLFGPSNQKQKGVYGLDIITRALFLNILCTLTTLQTKPTHNSSKYVHGYDILRQLLLDRPSDRILDETGCEQSSKTDLPFRMSLKTNPQEIMKVILENEDHPGGISETDMDSPKPRYTAWMREIQYTVDRHIEPITFLAQVLDYKFESAFRQLKLKSQEERAKSDGSPGSSCSAQADPEEGGLVMVDEGVVDHLITHLRLICTIVTTPPTTYRGETTPREQEKVRLEIMLSGFDKISKALRSCPHPTLYDSYIRFLQPLLRPWAELSPSDPLETSSNINSSSSRLQSSSQSVSGSNTLVFPESYIPPNAPMIPERPAAHPLSYSFRSGNWVENSLSDMLNWQNELQDSSKVHDPFVDARLPTKQNIQETAWEEDGDMASLDNYDDIFDDEEDDEEEEMEEVLFQDDNSPQDRRSSMPVYMRRIMSNSAPPQVNRETVSMTLDPIENIERWRLMSLDS